MGPLKGLKVIEMSAIGPVPLAGMLLADMGADVVIIDKAGDPSRLPDRVMRRGKRSLEIDLKSAAGVEQLLALIAAADILIEGFRPGVMERLGLGPDVFLQLNPTLVYGRMTGWGQTGPLAQAAGHDINYIALTGALQAIGRAGQAPTPPLNLLGDYGGGTMFLLMGVLAALHERKKSGQGQVVDAAITEGTANLMSLFYSLDDSALWSTRRASNLLDGAAHFYDVYETNDAKFISLGAIEPQFYALMREKLGLNESDFDAQHDPRQWRDLKEKIRIVIATKTRDQWCDELEGTDACFAPVLDYKEATEHHHMQSREAFIDVDGMIQPAPAPKFSRTRSDTDIGVETSVSSDEVLADWQSSD